MQAVQSERQKLDESIRETMSQRERLRETYERLLKERDDETLGMTQALHDKERELNTLRDYAKTLAESLRKKMDDVRHANRRHSSKQGPTSAAAWGAFETGVGFYQSQQWNAAAHAFEDCLKKDPLWGAAYQYLALSYHALGRVVATRRKSPRGPKNPRPRKRAARHLGRAAAGLDSAEGSLLKGECHGR